MPAKTLLDKQLINHIALVIDESGSMRMRKETVVQVVDGLVQHLATQSQNHDQETRVSIYTFADEARCLVYDKDVLRLPSLKGLYEPGGNTALIDATLQALGDLRKVPELYCDHSFLLYVITDGEENASRSSNPIALSQPIMALPENWTVATFVPSERHRHTAVRYGFPNENVAVWDAGSVQGVERAGSILRQATDAYMTSRAAGVRGTKSLFSFDMSGVGAKLAQGTAPADMTTLRPGQFRLLKVPSDCAIADFIEGEFRRPYRLGEAYYQLTKRETVQPQKAIAVYDSKEHKVLTGLGARALVGLGGAEVRVDAPSPTERYQLFIQSTSTNRKLLADTRVLVLS